MGPFSKPPSIGNKLRYTKCLNGAAHRIRPDDSPVCFCELQAPSLEIRHPIMRPTAVPTTDIIHSLISNSFTFKLLICRSHVNSTLPSLWLQQTFYRLEIGSFRSAGPQLSNSAGLCRGSTGLAKPAGFALRFQSRDATSQRSAGICVVTIGCRRVCLCRSAPFC
jgi:hypothetical protein